MSDGGLDRLFGEADEQAVVHAAPAGEKRRSPVLRWTGEVALIGLATVVVVATLRAGGISLPLLLLVPLLIGLRIVVWAAHAAAPPAIPRLRSRGGDGAGHGSGDALRAAVRRWELNLGRAHSDPDLYTRNVLPVLAELTDERLRLRHGITRASDPRRARELLGEQLWTVLSQPGRRGLKARDVETYVDALERL
ncbi:MULTISPECIES: hypothetical protein [Actinoplanes]|uniref:hypothetical protein n=1 Tax=Actinoplanes TaxID=1865 RepID=UPI000697FD6C|nr:MULTISPECIES: hypothetical protein [Actinoplanes]GLY01089.1 hypothetical protein Acsp01_14680 [Actinoplanes sp. NBRC 101535]